VIHGSDFRGLPSDFRRMAEAGRRPAIGQFSYSSIQLARDLAGADGRPLLTPVGRYLTGRAEILGKPVTHPTIIPAVRGHYTDGGELLAVPTQTSTVVLYANMTMLAAAGVSAIPRTWSEVSAACAALSRLRNGPPCGITWPNYGWLFQHAVAAQGGLLADPANGRTGRAIKVCLTSDQMLAYVQWWRQLHRAGHYLYTSRPSAEDPLRIWAENVSAFATGQVALCVSTSVLAERMAEAARAGGFELQVGRAPYNGDAPYHGSTIGGDALWLADDLDPVTREGALAFIEYLNQPQTVVERHKMTGYAPHTGPALDLLDREGWFAARPYRRGAVTELSTVHGSAHDSAAVLGNFAAIHDVMVNAMHDVLTSDAVPTARFHLAGQTAQRLLDDHNARVRAGEVLSLYVD
jgi:sn-glycerol 3-phosphate transport system substrate-binding protein